MGEDGRLGTVSCGLEDWDWRGPVGQVRSGQMRLGPVRIGEVGRCGADVSGWVVQGNAGRGL